MAARVRTGLTADCTGLEIGVSGNLVMTCPSFGGKLMARIICPGHRPQMATVRPGAMRGREGLRGTACRTEIISAGDLRAARDMEILEVIRDGTAKQTDIQNAKVLVAGGRGMGGAGGFELLEQLASLLGGTVAASRAAVDAGWAEQGRPVRAPAALHRLRHIRSRTAYRGHGGIGGYCGDKQKPEDTHIFDVKINGPMIATTEDVVVDDRGYIYIDTWHDGMYILRLKLD